MQPNELNFSGGPGALPETVLAQASEAVIALPETGLSVLGMSHRSKWFSAVLDEAESNIRQLLRVPSSHAILFLQGGGSLQFSMIPLSFGSRERPAAYVVSGYWSAKAYQEATRLVPANVIWSGEAGHYSTLPSLRSIGAAPDRNAFIHFVSNETVEGLQFPVLTERLELPVMCDMSSDFLSQPVDIPNYDLIYAHSQKNLGPAGVTVGIVSRKLLDKIPEGLPAMLDYRIHLQHKSNYNTPPVFAIYVLLLVTRWLMHDIGGVGAMHEINQRKAARVYATLARFENAVSVHADTSCRSLMNVAFQLREPSLLSVFLDEAADNGFSGLEGHRSLGGIRVSLYNAVSEAATEALCTFMEHFFLTRHA